MEGGGEEEEAKGRRGAVCSLGSLREWLEIFISLQKSEKEVGGAIDIVNRYDTAAGLHALFSLIACLVFSFYPFGAVVPVIIHLQSPSFL